MQLVIELPNELEHSLREQARQTGAALNQYIVGAIREKIGATAPKQEPLSAQETELFKKINAGFSDAFWNRLRSLDDKRKRLKLDEKERAELTGMTEQMEDANLERMKALIVLAEIRKTDLDQLMQSLGLLNGKHF